MSLTERRDDSPAMKELVKEAEELSELIERKIQQVADAERKSNMAHSLLHRRSDELSALNRRLAAVESAQETLLQSVPETIVLAQ